MKYRAEIDGLRAVAVVPVILFHADFDWFSGGFIGVDVFFVISGYLITTLLIDDLENNRFSIIGFYERRARRILPALFLVMLACIPFSWMLLLPDQFKDFSQSLFAVSVFASNILFYKESGYFELETSEKPLLHTWSLAVEEQYYIVFPIFLFLAWRFGRDRVFWLLVVTAVVSLVFSEWVGKTDPNKNFYLAPSRAWELLFGSLAAFIIQKNVIKGNNLLSLFGFAAIIFSIFFFNQKTPFPGIYTLVPVIGTLFIILYCNAETIIGRCLSTRTVVYIGLISYSAYLWHQPVLAFSKIYTLNQINSYNTWFFVCVSFGLAIFTYKYVEQPFRDRRRFHRKSILLFSFSGLGLFALIGIIASASIERLYSNYDLEKYLTAIEDWEYPQGLEKLDIEGAYIFETDKPIDLVFFGDSHAEQFSPLANHFKERGLNVAFLTGGGCPPFPNVFEKLHPHCQDIFNRLDRLLDQNVSVKKIIIVGCFNCYLRKAATNGSDKEKSKYNYFYFDGVKKLYFRDDYGVSEALKSFSLFIEKLSNDHEILVLGDNPSGYQFDPKFMLQAKFSNPYYFKKKYSVNVGSDFKVSDDEVRIHQMIASSVSKVTEVKNLIEIICPNNICKTLSATGLPIYKDQNHMRSKFVKNRFGDLELFIGKNYQINKYYGEKH
jgi:peptidoglycan/LPS O-acetylase OafA/YrhL